MDINLTFKVFKNTLNYFYHLGLTLLVLGLLIHLVLLVLMFDTIPLELVFLVLQDLLVWLVPL